MEATGLPASKNALTNFTASPFMRSRSGLPTPPGSSRASNCSGRAWSSGRSTSNLSPQSVRFQARTWPACGDTSTVLAPAASSALRGPVSSTCSNASATRIATVLPASLRSTPGPSWADAGPGRSVMASAASIDRPARTARSVFAFPIVIPPPDIRPQLVKPPVRGGGTAPPPLRHGSRLSGLEDHLDAVVLLVPECLVHLGALLQGNLVRDHERRVDLAVDDRLQELLLVLLDVGLSHLEGQRLVHRGAHRDLVREPDV